MPSCLAGDLREGVSARALCCSFPLLACRATDQTSLQWMVRCFLQVMGLKIWGAGWHARRGDSRSGNNYADIPAGPGVGASGWPLSWFLRKLSTYLST